MFLRLEQELARSGHRHQPWAWFHVSSLGEFEQGRPVIEEFRKKMPGYSIVLTFFSPSGYEVRKTYDQVDLVWYLPLDTPGNARKWVELIRPDVVFFVKYDFWFNFLHRLQQNAVPAYFFSVAMRPDQLFFQWYGRWFARHLRGVSHFFVQDEQSQTLLAGIGITRVTVTGDTRFDRVFTMAATASAFPLIEQFIGRKPVLIAGSTWKEDEELLFPFIRKYRDTVKVIMAPHDTADSRVDYIRKRSGVESVRYSELTGQETEEIPLLIIDSVGILSQLYRYATLAYIGGGFGNGIHNIQEPVTFGVPVFFGPKYTKFKEAIDLVALGGATCVNSSDGFMTSAEELLADTGMLQRVSHVCKSYVEKSRGATVKIMNVIEKELRRKGTG
jgi:3-deoxy-D-manno-octulosonic-acid transferase